ncbi:MAG TPA: FAD:protein FMN transferase [Treponemataceae bacterium]|nr:FAD:protein FMN transferase [Treponemataceae bacterium]
MKHFRSILLTISIFLFISCSQTPQRTEYVLGTMCTINLFNQGTEKRYSHLFSRLHELDQILSANTSTSNLAEINAQAGIAPVKAEPEVFDILQTALEYSKKTEGAFDPTIGPLVKTWNIGFDNAVLPEQSAIEQALKLIDYRNIELDFDRHTVFLRNRGMKLDFGAIAKGYAADELVALMTQMKIKRGIIDLGGNIFAFGEKSSGKPWTVGIRDPFNDSSKPIASIQIRNKSVVTSGIYERFLEQDGIQYHHILDTKNGYPVDNNLLSVSIISSSSTLADTLSTSVFALGAEKGKALVESLPDTDAILIFKDYHIETTGNIAGSIEILSDDFHIIQ